MDLVACVSAGYSGTAFLANLVDRYVPGAVGLHEPQPTYGGEGEAGWNVRLGRWAPLDARVRDIVAHRPWWDPTFRGEVTSHVYEDPTGRPGDGKRPRTRTLDLSGVRLLVESSIFLSPFVPAIRAERPQTRFVALFREPIAWAFASWRKEQELGTHAFEVPTPETFARRLRDWERWNWVLLRALPTDPAACLWLEGRDLFTPAGVRRLLLWAGAEPAADVSLAEICARRINAARATVPPEAGRPLDYLEAARKTEADRLYYGLLVRAAT